MDVLEYAVLVDFKEVESDVVRVGFDGIGKKLDLEWHRMFLQVNGRKSEPSRQDEDLDYFGVFNELLMNLEKMENFLVAEDDFGFEV